MSINLSTINSVISRWWRLFSLGKSTAFQPLIRAQFSTIQFNTIQHNSSFAVFYFIIYNIILYYLFCPPCSLSTRVLFRQSTPLFLSYSLVVTFLCKSPHHPPNRTQLLKFSSWIFGQFSHNAIAFYLNSYCIFYDFQFKIFRIFPVLFPFLYRVLSYCTTSTRWTTVFFRFSCIPFMYLTKIKAEKLKIWIHKVIKFIRFCLKKV